MPFLRVVISTGHDDLYLFCPVRAQFKNLLIDLHRYRTGVGYDHGLACQFVLSVLFIVLEYVVTERIDGLRSPQNTLHVGHLLLACLDLCFCGTFIG